MINKKIVLVFSLMLLVIFQVVAISALSTGQAKQDWQDAKLATAEKRTNHQEAKEKWMVNKSDENVQAHIDTGKDLLNSALDEAEAWLIWKQQEVESDESVSEELSDQIQIDINKNLAKIQELRTKVESVTTIYGVEDGLNFVVIGMVGDYLRLLTDVARDSGLIWVEKSNQYIDKIENYEASLRETAETIKNNQEIVDFLDTAKQNMHEARENINKAEISYQQVVEGGTPLIKFNEGNQYIQTAKANMLLANSNLKSALRLML